MYRIRLGCAAYARMNIIPLLGEPVLSLSKGARGDSPLEGGVGGCLPLLGEPVLTLRHEPLVLSLPKGQD